MPDYQELRYLAGKAEYLRSSISQAVWKASVVTAALTIALAFFFAWVTGNIKQDQEVAALVKEHRTAACVAYVKLAKLVIKAPGTPNTARLQNCDALPDIKFRVYRP